jgi:hypothetical protein
MAPRRRTRLRDIQPPESDAILRTYRVCALYQAAFGKEKRNSLRKKEIAPPGDAAALVRQRLKI